MDLLRDFVNECAADTVNNGDTSRARPVVYDQCGRCGSHDVRASGLAALAITCHDCYDGEPGVAQSADEWSARQEIEAGDLGWRSPVTVAAVLERDVRFLSDEGLEQIGVWVEEITAPDDVARHNAYCDGIGYASDVARGERDPGRPFQWLLREDAECGDGDERIVAASWHYWEDDAHDDFREQLAEQAGLVEMVVEVER